MENAITWQLLKERALDSTAEGVVIADCTKHDMPVIYVNNAFTEMTGYSYDEVVGKNCRFLQGSDTDTTAADKIRNSITARQPCKVEILNYRKDGTPFWNYLSITPIRDKHGDTTHFIGIQSDITRRRQAEDTLRVVNTKLKNDLQAAAQIQQSQLPNVIPAAKGFQFAWRFRPCQELAGDTLNILSLDDTHIAIYVSDVCGHGVRAALHSFSISQDLRSRQDSPNLFNPEKTLAWLNQKYPMDAQTWMFFTIVYGVLNVKTGEFIFSSAGHPGPVMMKRGHLPRILETHSFPIGVENDVTYPSQTIKLNHGDKIILYTDGVVEALSPRNITFSEERFLKTLKRNEAEPINGCLDAVMKSLENWACHVKLRDDLSLIGIESSMRNQP